MCVLNAIASGDTRTLVNILDNPNQYINGLSLLGYALLGNSAEAVDTLVVAGASPVAPVWQHPPERWEKYNRPLLLASTRTNMALVHALASRSFPEIFAESLGTDGRDAMMFAALALQDNTARMLYAMGADPTRVCKNGHDLRHFVFDHSLRCDVEHWQSVWSRKVPTMYEANGPQAKRLKHSPKRPRKVDPKQIPLF